MKKAVVLTEGNLDKSAAKTTHGLLRHSERFDIRGIIDSKFAGKKCDEIVPHCNSIPVYPNIESFLEEDEADYLIVGVATVGGYLPKNFKNHIKKGIKEGLNIISGLHHYLSEDEELSSIAEEYGVEIKDIRKPPPLDQLHYFKNRKEEIDSITIPFLGTDSSIGKRTALIEVLEYLKSKDLNVCWVATGQTGLLQGSKYGLPLDSIKGDFMVGELEHQIWRAWKEEKPDAILIEGQGSTSHPAYVCGSRAILAASQPDGVVLQHAPARKHRDYRKEEIHWPMPKIKDEIELIKLYSGADVIGIGINPEELTQEEKREYIEEYEEKFDVPAADVFEEPEKISNAIVEMINR